MNAPLWRAELTSAFDYCKWGAAVSVVMNLIFQYFFCADLVVLQNGVHNTKEEVHLNNKKKGDMASCYRVSVQCSDHYLPTYCSHASGDL